MRLFETVTDLRAQADVLRRRRYGVIEMVDERLARIVLRPWPKRMSILELLLVGRRFHARRRGNRCWLYYNQPLGHRNFLVVGHAISTSGATLRTVHGAMVVLDEIARIKQSDAVIGSVANMRISDRLTARWGWEPFEVVGGRRQFIKRFYGKHLPPQQAWRLMSTAVAEEPAVEEPAAC